MGSVQRLVQRIKLGEILFYCTEEKVLAVTLNDILTQKKFSFYSFFLKISKIHIFTQILVYKMPYFYRKKDRFLVVIRWWHPLPINCLTLLFHRSLGNKKRTFCEKLLLVVSKRVSYKLPKVKNYWLHQQLEPSIIFVKCHRPIAKISEWELHLNDPLIYFDWECKIKTKSIRFCLRKTWVYCDKINIFKQNNLNKCE